MTGDEFHAKRSQSGLSIRAAATLLGTTPQTIQRWETGTSRIPSEAAERIGAESRDADVLTKSERQELAGLLRRRARVAKADAKQRTVALMADFEAALAATFKPMDDAWAEIVAAANQAVADANALIAERCRARGIPKGWHPGVTIGWRYRGENEIASRRAELRRVATTRLAELEQTAVVAIERQAVEAETELVAAGMRSSRARELLEALPTVEALMPALDIAAVEAAIPALAMQISAPDEDSGEDGV